MIAKTETLGGCKILRVSGRVDFESALDFEHHINAMIQEAGDCYIIELSQVELLSSAGLRVMLSTAKRVAHRNAALALAAPSQVVRQVFEISHFNLLFKIFPSVPAAIAALKGTPEVAPPDESVPPVTLGTSPAELEETRSTELVLPVNEPAPQAPSPPKADAAFSRPPPTLPTSPPAAPSRWAETPTVAPPPLPSVGAEPAKAPAATVAPKTPVAGPARQIPPPLPPVNQPPPVSSGPVESLSGRPPGLATRREAKYPALLEVRAEGTSYPCKDGDVIGTEGRLAQPYFSQIAHLAPRHLQIGLLDGRWFVFTPRNVQHPFVLDGVALRPGERKILQFIEHQVEFSGHVFGFRLVTIPKKEGFLARIFGRKK
jgi:anti-sigma B factor antagonist